TTTSTTTTTTPNGVPAAYVWPPAGTRFANPTDAAKGFAVDYLGMTNARTGRTTVPSSGGATTDVEVFPNAQSTALTLVSLMNDPSAGWVVVGARADQIVVEEPQPHTAPTATITVRGQSTAFEAQLALELRDVRATTALSRATALGGSNGTMGPFSTTITAPTTARPLVLVLCGLGVSLTVAADLGLAPWDVLHQGLSERTGIPIGTVAILVGLVLLAAWLPLRERYGVGTLINVVLIGLVIDATLPLLPDHAPLGARVAMLLGGTFLFGPGSGLYIGVRLGPG